jgi:hypothetical protein
LLDEDAFDLTNRHLVGGQHVVINAADAKHSVESRAVPNESP